MSLGQARAEDQSRVPPAPAAGPGWGVARSEGGAASVPHSQGADASTSGRAPPSETVTGALEEPEEALEALLEQLGAFGVYQRYTLAMLCLPAVLAACYALSNVFVAAEVPFRCLVPECESAATAHYGDAGMTALLPALPCRRYMPLHTTAVATAAGCSRDLFHHEELVDCEHLVYESDTATVFAEFGLGCSEQHMLLSSVRAAALPLALLLSGYMADVWSRRAALCVCGGLAGVMGLLKSLSEQYGAFLALDFLEVALGHGFGLAGYVLLLESAAPPLRGVYASAAGVAAAAGGALLALAARQHGGWRALLRVLHAPALLLPLLGRVLHDSARHLVARGKGNEAARDLRTASRWNKLRLDESRLKAVEGKASGGSMLRSRVLLWRLALLAVAWAGAAGLQRGAGAAGLQRGAERQALPLPLRSAADAAAALLLGMSLVRLGRRRTLLAALALTLLACLAPYCTASACQSRGVSLAGRLGWTLSLQALQVFTAELFPTPARARTLAACATAGHLVSVMAEHTLLLRDRAQAAVYCACAMLAALATLAAPETTRRALPCDVTRAERLRRAEPTPRAPPPGVAPPPSPVLVPL